MEFGVIIVCSEKDFFLAEGCLASVKYFMPDVEVCLLIDGNPDYKKVQQKYNCKIIQKKDVANDYLRENSFGWGITKMISFWESPFDKFLLLDADTCIWGDLRKKISWNNNDMIIDQPQYQYDEKSINTWFFDTQKLYQIDPAFDPIKFSGRYFCTGMMFSKKNIFPVEWYKQLLEAAKVDPSLFINLGEMGMLNYMIFKSVSKGKLNVLSVPLQHICADYSKKHTKQTFPFKKKKPYVIDEYVIHYVGDWKPYMTNQISYHEPMTFFRKEFHKKVNPELTEREIIKKMKSEDKVYEKKVSFLDRSKYLFRYMFNPMYTKFKKVLD